jgi:hypothetical protein
VRNSRRIGDIELDEDFELQRRTWRFQRVALFVMVVIVAAGLLGLLGGNGPLASASAEDPAATVMVEYRQFLRRRASVSLVLHLREGSTSAPEVAVRFERSYIESFEVQTLNPTPSRVEAGATEISYYFEIAEPGQETTLTFHLEPQRFGRADGQIRIDEHMPVRFWQFVYP